MKTQLIQLLTTNFGIAKSSLTDTAHFERDLGLDSLERMDMIMQLEQEFDMLIPDSDHDQLKTLGQVVSYLEAHATVATH